MNKNIVLTGLLIMGNLMGSNKNNDFYDKHDRARMLEMIADQAPEITCDNVRLLRKNDSTYSANVQHDGHVSRVVSDGIDYIVRVDRTKVSLTKSDDSFKLSRTQYATEHNACDTDKSVIQNETWTYKDNSLGLLYDKVCTVGVKETKNEKICRHIQLATCALFLTMFAYLIRLAQVSSEGRYSRP